MNGVIGDSYSFFKLNKLSIIDEAEEFHSLYYYHAFLSVQLLLNISYDGERQYSKP